MEKIPQLPENQPASPESLLALQRAAELSKVSADAPLSPDQRVGKNRAERRAKKQKISPLDRTLTDVPSPEFSTIPSSVGVEKEYKRSPAEATNELQESLDNLEKAAFGEGPSSKKEKLIPKEPLSNRRSRRGGAVLSPLPKRTETPSPVPEKSPIKEGVVEKGKVKPRKHTLYSSRAKRVSFKPKDTMQETVLKAAELSKKPRRGRRKITVTWEEEGEASPVEFKREEEKINTPLASAYELASTHTTQKKKRSTNPETLIVKESPSISSEEERKRRLEEAKHKVSTHEAAKPNNAPTAESSEAKKGTLKTAYETALEYHDGREEKTAKPEIEISMSDEMLGLEAIPRIPQVISFAELYAYLKGFSVIGPIEGNYQSANDVIEQIERVRRSGFGGRTYAVEDLPQIGNLREKVTDLIGKERERQRILDDMKARLDFNEKPAPQEVKKEGIKFKTEVPQSPLRSTLSPSPLKQSPEFSSRSGERIRNTLVTLDQGLYRLTKAFQKMRLVFKAIGVLADLIADAGGALSKSARDSKFELFTKKRAWQAATVAGAALIVGQTSERLGKAAVYGTQSPAPLKAESKITPGSITGEKIMTPSGNVITIVKEVPKAPSPVEKIENNDSVKIKSIEKSPDTPPPKKVEAVRSTGADNPEMIRFGSEGIKIEKKIIPIFDESVKKASTVEKTSYAGAPREKINVTSQLVQIKDAPTIGSGGAIEVSSNFFPRVQTTITNLEKEGVKVIKQNKKASFGKELWRSVVGNKLPESKPGEPNVIQDLLGATIDDDVDHARRVKQSNPDYPYKKVDRPR